MPALGNPSQADVIAMLDLTATGLEGLIGALSASNAEVVTAVATPNGVTFDDYAPDGQTGCTNPAELRVPRAPLAAALAACRARTTTLAFQPHSLVLTTEDDTVQACLWSVGLPGTASPAAQHEAASNPSETATVQITPKAVLGGVGSLGVQFHLVVDGVPYPTNGWKAVTFDLTPGRHQIECFNSSGRRTYSRASTTLDVFAGQRLNLRFQQGATTFSKGKLVLE
jgi:hypothetical protein